MTGVHDWMARELRALEKMAHQCDWDEVARLLRTARALVAGELAEAPEIVTEHRPDYDENGFLQKIDDLIWHANNNEWTEVESHLIDARSAWVSLSADRRSARKNRLN